MRPLGGQRTVRTRVRHMGHRWCRAQCAQRHTLSTEARPLPPSPGQCLQPVYITVPTAGRAAQAVDEGQPRAKIMRGNLQHRACRAPLGRPRGLETLPLVPCVRSMSGDPRRGPIRPDLTAWTSAGLCHHNERDGAKGGMRPRSAEENMCSPCG